MGESDLNDKFKEYLTKKFKEFIEYINNNKNIVEQEIPDEEKRKNFYSFLERFKGSSWTIDDYKTLYTYNCGIEFNGKYFRDFSVMFNPQSPYDVHLYRMNHTVNELWKFLELLKNFDKISANYQNISDEDKSFLNNFYNEFISNVNSEKKLKLIDLYKTYYEIIHKLQTEKYNNFLTFPPSSEYNFLRFLRDVGVFGVDSYYVHLLMTSGLYADLQKELDELVEKLRKENNKDDLQKELDELGEKLRKENNKSEEEIIEDSTTPTDKIKPEEVVTESMEQTISFVELLETPIEVSKKLNLPRNIKRKLLEYRTEFINKVKNEDNNTFELYYNEFYNFMKSNSLLNNIDVPKNYSINDMKKLLLDNGIVKKEEIKSKTQDNKDDELPKEDKEKIKNKKEDNKDDESPKEDKDKIKNKKEDNKDDESPKEDKEKIKNKKEDNKDDESPKEDKEKNKDKDKNNSKEKDNKVKSTRRKKIKSRRKKKMSKKKKLIIICIAIVVIAAVLTNPTIQAFLISHLMKFNSWWWLKVYDGAHISAFQRLLHIINDKLLSNALTFFTGIEGHFVEKSGVWIFGKTVGISNFAANYAHLFAVKSLVKDVLVGSVLGLDLSVLKNIFDDYMFYFNDEKNAKKFMEKFDNSQEFIQDDTFELNDEHGKKLIVTNKCVNIDDKKFNSKKIEKEDGSYETNYYKINKENKAILLFTAYSNGKIKFYDNEIKASPQAKIINKMFNQNKNNGASKSKKEVLQQSAEKLKHSAMNLFSKPFSEKLRNYKKKIKLLEKIDIISKESIKEYNSKVEDIKNRINDDKDLELYEKKLLKKMLNTSRLKFSNRINIVEYENVKTYEQLNELQAKMNKALEELYNDGISIEIYNECISRIKKLYLKKYRQLGRNLNLDNISFDLRAAKLVSIPFSKDIQKYSKLIKEIQNYNEYTALYNAISSDPELTDKTEDLLIKMLNKKIDKQMKKNIKEKIYSAKSTKDLESKIEESRSIISEVNTDSFKSVLTKYLEEMIYKKEKILKKATIHRTKELEPDDPVIPADETESKKVSEYKEKIDNLKDDEEYSDLWDEIEEDIELDENQKDLLLELIRIKSVPLFRELCEDLISQAKSIEDLNKLMNEINSYIEEFILSEEQEELKGYVQELFNSKNRELKAVANGRTK